jgi:glycosyltransferase involved in cell wall biosynthesis
VCEILENGGLARSMGQRGREVVLAQLTWQRNAEHTIGFYEEVLAGAVKGR